MEALGMIETRGMVAMVEALDSMLKAADVRLISSMKAGGGLVTVIVTGDVGAVKAAVDAGAAAVRAINPKALRAENVIPRPDDSVSLVLKKGGKKKASKPKAPDPDPSPDNGGGAPKTEESEVISADNRSANTIEEEAGTAVTDKSEAVVEEASDSSVVEETTEAEENAVLSDEEETAEAEEVSDPEIQEAVPEKSVEDPEMPETVTEADVDAADEAEPEASEAEEEAEADAADEAEPEASEAEEEAEADEPDEAEPEASEAVAEAEADVPEEEAAPEAEPDTPEEKTDEVPIAELPQVKDRESIDQVVAAAGADALDTALEGLRVSELRKLARGYNGFSLTGRDISKANKKMLIEAFKDYYK
jgi:microcompartment protein CcmL/EutN